LDYHCSWYGGVLAQRTPPIRPPGALRARRYWGPDVHATSLLLYIGLLLLLVGINAAYYEFVLPYLAPGGVSRLWQVLGLALLTIGVFGLIFASTAYLRRDDAFDLWWQTGAPTVLISMACGVAVYALTAVYGRALAIVVAPTLRW
jgi:hypothetical protein